MPTPSRPDHPSSPVLEISGLNVYYGQAHAVQEISLALGKGVLAVVGRNGMGKSTLCKAITGLAPASGSIRFEGQELLGMSPDQITRLGIAYVPQGRRVWRSLSVDETLRLAEQTANRGAWNLARIYRTFPRLAERKSNGGGQLSGGEQQMLAIARALLFNPKLLVMDEPTEGLAPVIVEHVANLLKTLGDSGEVSILLIEQNLGVALEVADQVSVMVNGRIASTLPAAELANDKTLQRRLLGVSSGHGGSSTNGSSQINSASDFLSEDKALGAPVFTLLREQHDPSLIGVARAWQNITLPSKALENSALQGSALKRGPTEARPSSTAATSRVEAVAKPTVAPLRRGRHAYIVGNFDTVETELLFLKQCLDRRGLRTVTVDVATTQTKRISTAHVNREQLSTFHPQGQASVFNTNDGSANDAMVLALQNYLTQQNDLGGIIGTAAGRSAELILKAMQALPRGLPKILIVNGVMDTRTVSHEETDIFVMHSPREGQSMWLSNAAHALAGMISIENSSKH